MSSKRYLVFYTIFVGYALYSYNRKSVSFIIPKLIESGVDGSSVGLILSSQNMAYAISKFFGGVMSDKLSPRSLFSAGLFMSGAATIMFSMSDSVNLYVAAWFLNGLAQGVGWPAIAKLLKNWFRPDELGTWWSIASASANISGCFGPFLSAYLIGAGGWRFSLNIAGTATFGAAFLALVCLKDKPVSGTQNPSSEPKKGDKKPKKSAPKKVGITSYLKMLLYKPLLSISMCYLMVSFFKTLYTDWGQVFLIKTQGVSDRGASNFLSSMELGGFIGGILSGWLSDVYVRSLNDSNEEQEYLLENPRMMFGVFLQLALIVPLVILGMFVQPGWPYFIYYGIGSVLGAIVYGQIALFGLLATQIVPDELSGTSHAIAALAANLGSVVAGFPIAFIADAVGWDNTFRLMPSLAISTSIFTFLSSIFAPVYPKHPWVY